jgi:hypothetical protein
MADRVELTEGDIFRRIRASANIYLLKWVLHNWDDTTCQAILRRIGAAMPAGATLILIEGLQHPNTPHRFSMIDLQMLVVTDGGRERSVPELAHLISAAGLRPGRTRRTATSRRHSAPPSTSVSSRTGCLRLHADQPVRCNQTC